MVLGFILFWPLGLFILLWVLSGRSVKDLPQDIRDIWGKVSSYWVSDSPFHERATSDNAVFNEYQDAQYDRIREIKEEMKTRSDRFGDYRADVKRRADEDEFNRFMNESPGRSEG